MPISRPAATFGASPIASQNATAISETTLVILGTVLLTVSAKIFVPFFPVPMTLATLAVMLIAAAFGLRLGAFTVLAYLGEGLAGLPVFTYTPPAVAGPGYLLGPTGGFLAGFVLLAIIVGFATDRGLGRSLPKLFAAVLVADIVVFAMGFVWFAGFARMSSGAVGAGVAIAWAKGVQPFILGDLLKIVLATGLVSATRGLVDAVRAPR